MKQVEIDHFSHFKMPGTLRASGRGELAFLLKQANLEENRYDSDLWLLREEPLRLTAGGKVSRFWWRDDAGLVFVREDGGDDGKPQTTLHALSVDRPGEAVPFLTLDYDVEDIASCVRTASFSSPPRAAAPAEKICPRAPRSATRATTSS